MEYTVALIGQYIFYDEIYHFLHLYNGKIPYAIGYTGIFKKQNALPRIYSIQSLLSLNTNHHIIRTGSLFVCCWLKAPVTQN